MFKSGVTRDHAMDHVTIFIEGDPVARSQNVEPGNGVKLAHGVMAVGAWIPLVSPEAKSTDMMLVAPRYIKRVELVRATVN